MYQSLFLAWENDEKKINASKNKINITYKIQVLIFESLIHPIAEKILEDMIKTYRRNIEKVAWDSSVSTEEERLNFPRYWINIVSKNKKKLVLLLSKLREKELFLPDQVLYVE